MNTGIPNTLRSIILTAVMASLQATAMTSFAEECSQTRIQWGIDTGIGFSLRSNDTNNDKPPTFYLGFKGGYILNPQYMIGIELSGWLFEAGDLWDPSKGAGLSQSFIFGQIHPQQNSRLFIKLGGGYASNWNNNMGENHLSRGWGITGVLGYDRSLNNRFTISPFIGFSHNVTGGNSYNFINTGLGIMIRQ